MRIFNLIKHNNKRSFALALRQRPQRALIQASSAMTGGIRHSLLALRRSVCSSRNVFPSPASAVLHHPTALCKSAWTGTSFRSLLFGLYSVYVRDYSTGQPLCQGFCRKKSDKIHAEKHRVDWGFCHRVKKSNRRGQTQILLNNPPWRYTLRRFRRCIRGGGQHCHRASAQTCHRWRRHRWASRR